MLYCFIFHFRFIINLELIFTWDESINEDCLFFFPFGYLTQHLFPMLCSVTLVINYLSLHIQVLSTLSVLLFYLIYLVLVSHCHKFCSFTERFDTDTHTPSLFVFNIVLAMKVGIALNLKIDLGKTHALATSSLLFRSFKFSLHYIKSCKFLFLCRSLVYLSYWYPGIWHF